jgi:mono/diheme cytochrome c family protein
MQEASERIKRFAGARSVRAAAPLLVFALSALAPLVAGGCAQEDYPVALWMAQHGEILDASAVGQGNSQTVASAGSDAAISPSSPTIVGSCPQAAAQPMPQRLVVMSASASTAVDLVYVSDLFNRFQSVCGSCHGPAVDPPGQGGFQITSSAAFSAAMTATVLGHITSDGVDAGNPLATDPMPPFSSPNGGPYDQRPETDPVKQFGELVAEWLAAGSPQSFAPPSGVEAGAGDASAPSQYLMSQRVGDTQTNIGSCVPDKTMVAVEQDVSTKLDAMFAALTKAPAPGPGILAKDLIGLPEQLSQTDLMTLDTAQLAQYGVVAYQPTYPLWTDDAGKLRYVRVPRGTSIQFDKTTQEFKVPPNTRFYKTFLRKIIDTDGSYRWRKIETRLIVSRPDQINADGSATPTALFGTYLWNEGETEATLLEAPLRDGLPFSDALIQYTTDEQLAAEVLAANPVYPLDALINYKAARHYAVPSSDRCMECHMGSNSASFVLGFRPLQLKRRALGEGGTLVEPGQGPPGADELTQLQRFIDYGVITGVSSADDILSLENSEGARTPRPAVADPDGGTATNYELTAQGYMVGNCSHCHNPRGYPSVENPVLVDVLNFLPGPNGGIFQFPLERYSPRIGRGPGQATPIPYITPSLMDQPSYYWDKQPPTGSGDNYFFNVAAGSSSEVFHILYAPWRSLIFRNVNTPFTYQDNLALYPHMPMNSPGYDCRAKQILGDWMVSIPAIRKDPEIAEYAFATEFNAAGNNAVVGGAAVDDNPQPYVEVLPGTPGYAGAVLAAQQRLAILHSGTNASVPADNTFDVYHYCPDTSDILDPNVTACYPVPYQGEDSTNVLTSATPPHAHWVNTDLSQTPQLPGTFAVRRADWPTVLVETPATVDAGAAPAAAQCPGVVPQVAPIDLLQNVYIDSPPDAGAPSGSDAGAPSAFRTFATTAVPFGIWEQQAGCDFSHQSTVASVLANTSTPPPLWMTNSKNLAPSAPVFMASPGQAVFQMICINCHGPDADAKGRLSDNLATMTGGNAIVADFKDGLFGPLTSPGLHKSEAFADSMLPSGAGPNWTNATIDDRASRYMAFMALGGTEVQIPNAILTIVADTQVLGVRRVLPSDVISANMLSAAKAICRSLLENDFTGTIEFDWTQGWFQLNATRTQLPSFPFLIPTNGDAELWLHLCNLNNPPPVRALYVSSFSSGPPYTATSGVVSQNSTLGANALIDPGVYAAAKSGQNPVGDETGATQKALTAGNNFPWCVAPDIGGASDLPGVTSYLAANNVPVCPVPMAGQCPAEPPDGGGTPQCWSSDRIDQWASRGAINAGLAVFTYVEALENNLSQGLPANPTYDQCQQLP